MGADCFLCWRGKCGGHRHFIVLLEGQGEAAGGGVSEVFLNVGSGNVDCFLHC